VRLFDVENSRPSDLVRELELVFKAYALSDKSASVKFLPVDRINTLIAVAPNPGIFTEVESWIKKLDIAVKITAGAVNNYVYRLKYGRAETVSMAITALYTGNTMMLASLGSMTSGMGGGIGYGGGIGGGMGYGGMGGGMGYGGMGYGGMGYGGMGGSMGYGGMGYGGAYTGYAPPMTTVAPGMIAPQGSAQGGAVAGAGGDLTGSYLGYGASGAYSPYGAYGGMPGVRIPHVIPNPFDNTLLIQGTPQEYEQISNLLRQLDVPPRQVLIDTRIYEVDLTGAFAAGVGAYLEKQGTGTGTISRTLNAASSVSGLTLSAGALVLRSHELLGLLTAQETAGRSRVISAPSIIATDSVPATMNVGDSVPILTSQAVAGVQSGGSSLFTNTISNQSSGTTLNILARVNSSGVVTMVVNQQVSSPSPPSPGAAIQSPSFSNRSVQTQITVQDGDTVAISGIITEKRTDSSGGIPILHRIPVLGTAFGAKNSSVSRTELVIFLTPRVIYDTNQIVEASDEIKNGLKRVQKLARDQ
jgi:general secretion pathway protein D